jgi:hypothetical protein
MLEFVIYCRSNMHTLWYYHIWVFILYVTFKIYFTFKLLITFSTVYSFNENQIIFLQEQNNRISSETAINLCFKNSSGVVFDEGKLK